MTSGVVGRTTAQAILWTYAVLSLGPLLLVVVNSFRTTGDIVAAPLGLPDLTNTDNYQKALGQGQFFVYLLNTLAYVGLAVAICTIVSTAAVYALVRWRLPGGSALILVFLAGMMIPLRFAVVPLFYEFEDLALIDTRIGLTLFYAASGIPFSTFLLVPFIRQLPQELEEAAAIDGANEFTTFVRVMAPQLRPVVAVVAVFNFVPLWNEFFFPLILLRTPDKFPVAVGLTTFFGKYSVDLGPLFAALTLVSAPLVVVFVIASRRIVDGLTAGMTK